MSLLSGQNTKNLLKKHKMRPSKGLGQHFLVDKGVLKKILATADIRPNDIVLEIGPGTGILTTELAKKAKRVVAVEKDPRMASVLKETVKDFKNVKVMIADALKIQNTRYKIQDTPHQKLRFGTGRAKYKVVANLPYYITSPIIRKFLESKNPPSQMVLMVQKEVAKRIAARPPDMSLLAASVQFYAKAKIIGLVSKKSFWPQPKVDSAIIKISNLKSQISEKDRELFFKIVRAGFAQPRKQILNNLAKELKLNKEEIKARLLKNKIKPEQRAETLSLQDWSRIVESFR